MGMAIALLAINLLAICIAFLGLNEIYRRDIHQAEILSQNLTHAIDQNISNTLRRIDLSLITTAGEFTNYLSSHDRLDKQFVEWKIKLQKNILADSEGWSVTDSFGKFIFHEGAGDTPSVRIDDRDYFQELRSGKNKGLAVSSILDSKLTGHKIIILARSYYDKYGKFSGVVAVPLPLSIFSKQLSGFQVGKNGILALRDKNLGLVSLYVQDQPKFSYAIADTNVSPAMLELVRKGVWEGTYHARRNSDDIERIYHYHKIDGLSIFAITGISKSDHLEQWYRIRLICFALLGLFLLILNSAAVMLYRQWNQQHEYLVANEKSNKRLKRLLQKLRERDEALRASQDAGGLGTYSLDILNSIWTSSEKQDSIFGIDPDYPRTISSWDALIHADDRDEIQSYLRDSVLGKGEVFDHEYRLIRPCDGKTIWVHGLGKLEFDEEGNPVCLRGTIQDVSARKLADENLHLARRVFESTHEAIMVTDVNGIIQEVNPALCQLAGYPLEELIGRNPRLLSSGVHDSIFYKRMWAALLGCGSWQGEIVNRKKDGTFYTQRTHITAIRNNNDEITHFAAMIADISVLKEHQRQIEYLAYHDKLTGLPNRVLLSDRMRQLISVCNQRKELLSVGYLDLDDFKPINDRWGHEAGDKLLAQVAGRLSANLRSGDVAARLGGDEFIVLFCGFKHEKEIKDEAGRLLQRLTEPYSLDGFQVTITVSIGVTVYPTDAAHDPDTLIRHADQAMYQAKRCGKNCMHFFDPVSERESLERQTQYQRVVDALMEKEFCLFYQPKIDLHTGAVSGVEALIRWQHPDEGLLSPARFLPVIESTDLTLQVGEWILHEVMRQKQCWSSLGINLPVSINIFAKHLQRADFVERLKLILADYKDVDPYSLEFEILETTAMENLQEISQRLQECRDLGIRFSLDDFGTGYSSLTYLRQLPVDVVKIDRSFIYDILDNKQDQVLVQGVVSMARTLNRQVTAEGVETIEHAIPLIRFGCDQAQGYGIAKPMAPEKIPAWVAQWTKPAAWSDCI